MSDKSNHMKTIPFKGQNVVIAENQPEYIPIPACYFQPDPYGRIVFCWQLTLRERLWLLVTGVIWHTVMTMNKPLQPQLMDLTRPEFPGEAEAELKRREEAEELDTAI